MDINVKKRGEEWNVVFNHGVQYFTLDYHVDTQEEAEWMKTILAKCFSRAFGETSKKESVLNIPVVSVSLANDEAIKYAKLKHSDEYKDQAFERDIAETEIDFARGFVACNEYLKANGL